MIRQNGLPIPARQDISSMAVPHVPFAARFYMFQKTNLFPPCYSERVWLPMPNVGRLLVYNNDISHSTGLTMER